jgi:hypothetical protein
MLAASVRNALQCVAQVEVLTSGWDVGIVNAFRVISRSTAPSGMLSLRLPDRSPFLQLKIALDYQVLLDAREYNRPLYRAEIARYLYVVHDVRGRELFAYHLHPDSVSDVWTPHLHVSVAQNVALPSGPGNRGNAELPLGKLHFPTRRIDPSQLVRFLITELGVGPRRPDWESVLDRIERSSR